MILLLFILAISSPAYSADATPWLTLLKTDLDFIRTTLLENHPGAVDQENPGFKSWLDKGYQEAMASAESVTNFDGLFFVEQRYVNGFQDVHLSVPFQIKRDTYAWPGFIVGIVNGRFEIVESSKSDLPKGSLVTSCDGQTPDRLLESKILPYFGISSLAASRTQVSPYLFAARYNPFSKSVQSCEFKSPQGKLISKKLEWEPISKIQFDEKAGRAAFGSPAEDFSLRQFGDNSYWLTLPDFWPEGEHLNRAKQVINEFKKELSKIKKGKILVLDVRGNSGGSSHWGHEIAELLWGKEMIAALQNETTKNERVDWRVSPGNFRRIQQMTEQLTAKFGSNAPITQYFAELLPYYKKSLDSKQTLFRQPQEEQKPRNSSIRKTQLKPKIFFLTDGACMSACLDFADILMSTKQVVHIGTPTLADTNYMEVAGEPLPSALGRLNFAMKVYRSRPRKSGQPYEPQFVYPGDISDTKALQEWIRGLTKAGKQA